jgi:hypothetical protein
MHEFFTRPETMERLVIGEQQLDNLIEAGDLTPLLPFGDDTPSGLILFGAAEVVALSRRDLRGAVGPAASGKTQHRHAPPAAVDRAKRRAAEIFGDLAQRRADVEAEARQQRAEEDAYRLMSYAMQRLAGLAKPEEKVVVASSIVSKAKARPDWPKW